MKRSVIVLIVIFASLLASASSTRIKVKKVKGQMALVEFQGKMAAGESYLLVPGENSTEDFKTGPRAHRLGATFNFNSLKTKTSSVEYNPSEFTINADFGWNHESYEVGPILGYSSVSTGFGGSSTNITAGFFYDYNFTENKEPVSYLFGTGFKMTYTNVAPASGSSGLYTTAIYPNIFWKWWAFAHSTALKLDFGYDIENGRDSAATTFSTSGVKSTAALLFYY